MSQQFEYFGNELDLFKSAHNWKRYFTRRLKSHIKGDVLEVGSGIGANTPFFVDAAKDVNSWTLLEPDKNLFTQAKGTIDTNLVTDEFRIEHINGTIDLVHDKKYDTILYIDVIEHIKDAETELKKATALLNEEGKLIVLVPAYQCLFNDFDHSIGHYRRYNKELLEKHKGGYLKTHRLFYLDSMGFFAALINKWILKKELPSEANINLWDKVLVPVSKVIDGIIAFSFGKSLIGIFINDRKE